MKHTALYLRVSTEAQADEGYSLAAQAEKLEAYCRMKGIGAFRRYVDGGFSGSNLTRPAVTELIEAIRGGAVERVVVYKLDRLSRSQKDTLYLIEDVFLPNGVDFVSINENIDTGSPYGRAMIGILSAFAQLERENIFLRTRMGMVERVKQGYWPGGGKVPFGYDYDAAQGMRVLRLIENMTMGTAAVGYLPESMHGAGSPQAQRIMIARQSNLEMKKQLAKDIARIK